MAKYETTVGVRLEGDAVRRLDALAAEAGVTRGEMARKVMLVGIGSLSGEVRPDIERLAGEISELAAGMEGLRAEVGRAADSMDGAGKNISLVRKQSLNAAQASLANLAATSVALKTLSKLSTSFAQTLDRPVYNGYAGFALKDIFRLFLSAGGALSRDPSIGFMRAFRDMRRWGFDPADIGFDESEMLPDAADEGMGAVARDDERRRGGRKGKNGRGHGGHGGAGSDGWA